MHSCSRLEQEFVSRRYTPLDNGQLADFPDQSGPVSFKLSTFRVRPRKGRVKGTLVLLERGLRAYPLSQIRVIKSCRPIK